MSNHLAIATVTAALRNRLTDATNADLPGASVTNERPNASGLPEKGINIFLYQVTPNVAFRNRDAPTRRADATLQRRSSIALDLHYMLSFYGTDETWEPQILLGSAARAMHSRPALPREEIAAMLGLGGVYSPLAS